MITIPEVVEQIISESLFFEEGLSEGIINYSALARKIKPDVEKKLLKDVELGAILMALRRITKKKKPSESFKKMFQAHHDLIVRSNLIEFVLSNTDFSIEMHKDLIKLAEEEEEYFMTITEGVFETTIITSNELREKVLSILSKTKITTQLTNLSSITIRLPKENVYIPGLYYYFLKSLAREGINIVEIVSTYTEITIILEDKVVDKAFSILKKSTTVELAP
ncbi:MAG: hypothetical protein Q7R95_08785 [bacterium]|nr:hypothetical protein [bacterium]